MPVSQLAAGFIPENTPGNDHRGFFDIVLMQGRNGNLMRSHYTKHILIRSYHLRISTLSFPLEIFFCRLYIHGWYRFMARQTETKNGMRPATFISISTVLSSETVEVCAKA